MRSKPLVVTLWFLMILGCDVAPQTTNTPSSVARAGSWTDQLAAVRRGDSSEIHVTDGIVTDDEWRSLATDCESLTVLDVETLQSDNSPLALLSGLPRLRQLRIGSSITDADLAQIATVTSLQVLNLPNGEFTDEGLRELTTLPNLELLRFHSPQVTDAGMQTVSRFPSLRFLHLIDVPISDAGLQHLEGFTQLESLYLDGCDCTDEGLGRLLEALPELHLHRDQLHLPDDPHDHKH